MSRTLLAVPLIGPSVEEALATLNEQNRLFDVAEIRMDLIAAFRDRTACEAAPDLRRLLTPRPCPVIVTNRPTRQGGSWSGDEGRRLDLLAEARIVAPGRLGDMRAEVEEITRMLAASVISTKRKRQAVNPDIRTQTSER